MSPFSGGKTRTLKSHSVSGIVPQAFHRRKLAGQFGNPSAPVFYSIGSFALTFTQPELTVAKNE
jgi:hypothetical protein